MACHGHGVSGLKGVWGLTLGVPSLMGPSFSLFQFRFAIVTITAIVLQAGLRLPVTSQGWVAVWTAVLCSLKVCPRRGEGGRGQAGRSHVVHLGLRRSLSSADRDAFTLAVILSSVMPLLPGAGLAWCCCRRPGLCLQRCFWGSRRDLMCSG